MEIEFLSWWDSLPPDYRARSDFYTVGAQNIHRCHLIFLQDVKMQCYQLMKNLTEFTYDNEIARCVTTVRDLVDKMCATTPYDFGDDDMHEKEMWSYRRRKFPRRRSLWHSTLPSLRHCSYRAWYLRYPADSERVS
jgi:hypothetical protein